MVSKKSNLLARLHLKKIVTEDGEKVKKIVKVESKTDVSKYESWKWYKEQVNAKPKKKKSDNQKKQIKDREPHVSDQNLVQGSLVKGICNYVYLDVNKVEKVSKNAEFYALNAWHYLGNKENIEKGRKEDGTGKREAIYEKPKTVGCYTFYNKNIKHNFYQAFPKKAINLDELSKIEPHSVFNRDEIDYFVRVISLHDEESKSKIGQRLPYTWEAHHILPMSCFFDFFEEEELAIIRRSTYDINEGSNIIFLPEDNNDTRHHGLPYHSSNHLNYNERVRMQFEKIRTAIESVEEKDHEAISSKVEIELHKLEDKNYKYLSKKFTNGQRLD